nr:MAG TPA: hypothetical protein [Caudoviricetes sp.]
MVIIYTNFGIMLILKLVYFSIDILGARCYIIYMKGKEGCKHD